jgi:hypothetical protein
MEYQIEDAEKSGGSKQWRGLVNGRSTKRGPKLRRKGWVGLFVNTLGMRNRVAQCAWVMFRMF